ncbi:hypothetical protein MAC_06553 [Metarhizium acridum CQMa 102]|uniref:Uncharacterized protein n=1 Tax=Metarhizium acridum (strain CQMa 102) TaxID=655827 RepID=E9E9K5_METAQ|nr:uncharacterized protein MAC_06553 [Metarhizium acridum CQMa 102]EFY87445.1 hypothetical protein MAC_06553 [Metarhizium acridum CQMa 102]
MIGSSHGEKTNLYAWLKGHHRSCAPESDCSLLLWKLEAQDLNSTRTVGDNNGNRRVFSVPRPSDEATTRWGDEPRIHGAAGPTSRAESENNFAAQYSQADCSFSGYHNGGDVHTEPRGESTAAFIKDGADRTDPYVSDGEDSGRISPDTYRLWTTGCARGQNNTRQGTDNCGMCHVETAGLHAAHEHIDLVPDDSTTASCPSISSGEFKNDAQQPKPLTNRLHDQISTLQETLDSIAAHAGKVMRRRHPLRTEADREEHSEREDIYAYLEDYMCRLDAECDARHEKLCLLAREVDKLREREHNLNVMIEAVGETVGVGVEEVNGDVGEIERLVRLINDGEMDILSGQEDH